MSLIFPIREARGQGIGPQRSCLWDGESGRACMANICIPLSSRKLTWTSPLASGNLQASAPWDPTPDTGQCEASGWQYDPFPRKHQEERTTEDVSSRARLKTKPRGKMGRAEGEKQPCNILAFPKELTIGFCSLFQPQLQSSVESRHSQETQNIDKPEVCRKLTEYWPLLGPTPPPATPDSPSFLYSALWLSPEGAPVFAFVILAS